MTGPPRHEFVRELNAISMPAPEDDSTRQPRAVVTEGNLPSEAVFRRAGFRRV